MIILQNFSLLRRQENKMQLETKNFVFKYQLSLTHNHKLTLLYVEQFRFMVIRAIMTSSCLKMANRASKNNENSKFRNKIEN